MTKPLFESINSRNDKSFSIRVFEQEGITSPYHYHPEFELTLITRGNGKRNIGNHMDQFSNGDLVFLGPNLPHCWKTDPFVRGEMYASSIVIQFTSDFLEQDFLNRPELLDIRKLLERSKRGIIYNLSVAAEISGDLRHLAKEESNFKKLHRFFAVLHKLSVTAHFSLLNHPVYKPIQSWGDLERINNVFGYIIDNYKTNVSLDEVAHLACMTPNAFCKYFKKVTQRTFIGVVLEYRLRYATSQLLHTNKTVTQICFDCGFNDTVHFIRMFKSKMRMSPLQYKKQCLKTVNLFDDPGHVEDFPDGREVGLKF